LDLTHLPVRIGRTFQVSDSNITATPVRWIALCHFLLAHLFGAVILAVAINPVATLLSRSRPGGSLTARAESPADSGPSLLPPTA
jgi:Protein of unknown function (DUF1345)